jgi:hypothetical protein
MSLKSFHLVFISASVLLALAFAAWCFGEKGPAGAAGTAAGVFAIGAAAALAGYEAWFVRRMRRRS